MFSDVQSYFHTVFIYTITILAVLNPFGNLPQFLSMTDELKTSLRQKLFRTIIYTAFIIVVIFVLAGPYIMDNLFRISIPDLRIAGGIILIIMGIKNLLFPLSNKYAMHVKNEQEEDVIKKSILPMAFPMLVGPGTLSTAIILSSDNGILTTLLSAFLAFLVIFILFAFASIIERLTGKLILHVVARIFQVFIVSIGVKMIITGIYETLKLPRP